MDYIELADGTKISTANGAVIKERQEAVPVSSGTVIPVPTMHEAQDLVVKTERRLSDLPDVPKNMHPIALIVSYELFGLSPAQIAIATNTSLEYVERMMDLSTYHEMRESVVNGILESSRNSVEGLINQHAHTAATKMTQFLNADDDAVVFAASKEILNRAKIDGGKSGRSTNSSLRIEITKPSERTESIKIEMR